MPWKRGDGYGLRNVDISFTEAWCASNSDHIFHLQNGKWEIVSGRLHQISVGENGLWGTSSMKHIFSRLGITASEPKGTEWYQDTSGLLSQITSGRPGKVEVNQLRFIFSWPVHFRCPVNGLIY